MVKYQIQIIQKNNIELKKTHLKTILTDLLSTFQASFLLILITMACVLTLQHRTARRERYLVYELLPGGDVHSRLNKDLRREVLGGSFHTWNIE